MAMKGKLPAKVTTLDNWVVNPFAGSQTLVVDEIFGNEIMSLNIKWLARFEKENVSTSLE